MGARRSLARFRRLCYSIFYACIRYQPPPVGADERLTRFLFDAEKEIDRHGNCTWKAFFDAKGRPVSVIRPAEMFDDALWRFGDKWVACEREAAIEARVDFSASRLAPDLRAI